jgi:sortase B
VTVVLVIAIIVFGSIALLTTLVVLANTSSLRNTRAEFDHLREIAGDIESEFGEYGVMKLSVLDEEMRRINPDYVCWIKIDGTEVDYPVVRGIDNESYLHTSFYGEENIAGAVFMDYRNTGDFAALRIGEAIPHIIIYGHNLQQGGMFGELHRLLNNQFLEENNLITLIVNDRALEFEIFSVRLTDIEDPAYFLNFSTAHAFPRFANRIDAPIAATQIITLSTCVVGGSDDDRLIVQGYRLLG